MIQLKFFGTRGSYPQSGSSFIKIGGHTSCVGLMIDHHLYVIDAGTGLISLANDLKRLAIKHIDIFLSHLHLDHILGLPFFAPIWEEGFVFNIYSGTAQPYGGIRRCIEQVFQPPFFPVPFEKIPSTVYYHDFKVGTVLHPRPMVFMRTVELDHPNGACGYRFEHRGKNIVYLSDTVHSPELENVFRQFAQGADALIYDAAFTPEEYQEKPTWGHSTWVEAARLAKAAEVKTLYLYHHAPWHTDEQLLEIEHKTRALFPETVLAYDGLEVDF
jgi:phosphoribosyl 1,2-cyclic phosphodiesterase